MRKSVWLGVFLAGATLGVGLYLARWGRPVKAQTITLNSSLVALLPADATTLVGVDVERLKRTALYRHLEEQSQKNNRNHFDEFTAATGFDPRRDVQELLLASWTGPDGKDQFVAVGRGQFNVGAISGQLREKKVKSENYRGLEVFHPEADAKQTAKGPREPGAFTLLDSKTAVAGTRGALLAAIDRRSSNGPSLAGNAALLARAQTISAASQVWAVSQKPGDVVNRALPKGNDAQNSNFARIFASMENTTFALDLMNGLDLRAAGLCRTSEDAKTLGDAARGFVAIGRLSVSQKDPEMMSVFDGIRVEERSSELDITIHIDSNAFDKLLEKGKSKGKVQNVSYSR